MEVESQLSANSLGRMNETTVFYSLNIPLHYHGRDKHHHHDFNNLNIKNSDVKRNHYQQNVNMSSDIQVPLNMIPPPPPHKLVSCNTNNNNVSRKWKRKENAAGGLRDNFRPISPKGYESDESCTSYASRETLPVPTGMRYNSRHGSGRLSQSSPNVYQPNSIYQQNNGNYHKNRYYPGGNGRQKSIQHRNCTDIIMRRAHGLVERFKSRAELMKIDPNPPDLLTGGSLDQLNQAIWDVFISKAQKEKTYESKISLWKDIFLYIRKCLSSYGLFMVGSTMSGFGLESSDIDMCLLTKPLTSDPRIDSLHHLTNVRHLLIKVGITMEPELILAKVPILKFKDKETGFEIDLNCNNAVGIRNTHLLHCYAHLDWRVRPLVIMVKLWAQANNINDAKNMTISSYSWALMAIHYLQCGVTPPVLPCLHGLLPEKFNSAPDNHNMDVQEEISTIKDFKSDNVNCLAELFIGFLQYYSYFDYSHYAISVRAGSRLPIDECRFMRAPKNDPHQWKCLCIEEPFDFTNTARSVFDHDIFKHIKNVIVCSYNELAGTKLLSNILPVHLELNLNQR